MVKCDDAIAQPEAGDSGTNGGYDPGRLMAVDARRSEQVVLDFLEVCVANPAGLDANQDLAGADGWRWNPLHANHAAAAINGGVHGFRDDESVRIGSRQ
jgi:hypothetical protein